MRYYLDTEFHEYPNTINLISLALVAEDTRELYLENSLFDWATASDWLRQNVKPHLLSSAYSRDSQIELDGSLAIRTAPNLFQDYVLDFVGDDPSPVFWGYYADFDWVAFCWCFGPMVKQPAHFPKYCRDLKQLADEWGNPRFTKPELEHNALVDARWSRDLHDFLLTHQSV